MNNDYANTRDIESTLSLVNDAEVAPPAETDDTAALSYLSHIKQVKADVEEDKKSSPDYYKRVYLSPHPTLSTAPYCEHRLDTQRRPRLNCANCWDYFFVENQGFTSGLADVLLRGTPEQVALIAQVHGDKLFKHLKRFVARVQELQQLATQENGPVLKADYEFKTYAEVEAEARATGQEVAIA